MREKHENNECSICIKPLTTRRIPAKMMFNKDDVTVDIGVSYDHCYIHDITEKADLLINMSDANQITRTGKLIWRPPHTYQ